MLLTSNILYNSPIHVTLNMSWYLEFRRIRKFTINGYNFLLGCFHSVLLTQIHKFYHQRREKFIVFPVFKVLSWWTLCRVVVLKTEQQQRGMAFYLLFISCVLNSLIKNALCVHSVFIKPTHHRIPFPHNQPRTSLCFQSKEWHRTCQEGNPFRMKHHFSHLSPD